MDEIKLGAEFRGNFNKEARRASKLGCFVVVLVLLVMAVAGIMSPAIDYQWFVHDVRHPEVFTLRYEVESSLFFLAFLATVAFLWINLGQALKFSNKLPFLLDAQQIVAPVVHHGVEMEGHAERARVRGGFESAQSFLNRKAPGRLVAAHQINERAIEIAMLRISLRVSHQLPGSQELRTGDLGAQSRQIGRPHVYPGMSGRNGGYPSRATILDC